MSDDLEDVLKEIATHVYESVKQFGIGDRAYERAMSEELLDRGVNHEAHKKIFDDRKGKYKFIDLYFPDHARFAKIKTRKYITRTELAELKEEEQILGLEGMIINFYNGISIRHTTSGRIRGADFESMVGFTPDGSRSVKSRMTLPHLSGSTSRLNDLADPVIAARSNRHMKHPPSVIPIIDEKESFHNADKIFSLSCAAFFLSEGDRKEFVNVFNSLLESMKLAKISVPDKFLEGSPMKAPDGELGDTLKKVLDEKLTDNKKGAEKPPTENGTDEPEGEEEEEEEEEE